MNFNKTAAVNEVRERLRARVPEFIYDNTAAQLTETLATSGPVPAAFVLLRFDNTEESVPGRPAQRIDVDVIVGIITQSVAEGPAAAITGPRGADAIEQKVITAIHWWQPSWATDRCKFRGEPEQATKDGTRLFTQLRFRTRIFENHV